MEPPSPQRPRLPQRINALNAANAIEGAPQRVQRKHASAEEPITARIRRRQEAMPTPDHAVEHARDILGLTKLNYNECKLGESQHVTVGFSDVVGEILISNPTVTDRRPTFKFYI